jgi:Nif-specific regulatory protein
MPNDKHFEAVYELTKKLNSIEYESSLVNETLDIIIEALDAERGLFVKYDKDRGDFQIISARNVNRENIGSVNEFSSGVLNQVVEQGKPILYHDVLRDPVVSKFDSIRIRGIKSVIGVPIFYENNLWGVILVDSTERRDKFTEQSLAVLEVFSNIVTLALDKIIGLEKLRDENFLLQNQVQSLINIPEIVGESVVIKKLKMQIHKVAQTDATVLITGESGTGKDLIARAIHRLSPRKDYPYLAQFCGSIPDTLLESELFGYKKGAFTGATTDKKGLLEATDKGTFFLDEIADISPALQAKLLRVLENKEIIRLGDTEVRKIDVRIITATNKNLQELVKNKEFREDLFYRLNVFPIKVPPLRERHGDIPLLAKHFLELNGGKHFEFDKKAIKKLESYNWPGNVRQLINVVQRAIINAQGNVITADDIYFDIEEPNVYGGTLEEIERAILLKRLEEFGGNKTLAAKSLGVSRKWIYLKLGRDGKTQ